MDSLPNGPPTSYGPSSSPQMPLFSPQQVAQLSDPRNSTSMLPFGRDQMAAGEQLRVPGFFQALFPGYDQFQGLQEARQREFEWRQSMETMIESLGLELRASRSENQRLREELHEARKDMSRYGTPEDRSTSESPEVLRSMGVKGRLTLEDGAAAQQVLPEHALVPKKKKTKEDGTEFRQVRNKEDGTEFRQVRTKEDGTEFRQASQKEDGTEFRQVRKKEDGAETQQAAVGIGWTKVPTSSQVLSSEGEQSEQSEESEEEGVGGQRSSSKPSKRGAKDPTLHVLLKIVDTMQPMQKSMLKVKEETGEELEVVRSTHQLPKLPEWCADTAPIDYNDWLTCLEVHMSDLSRNSQQWWEATTKTVAQWYNEHMNLSPIQRLSHAPAVPEELQERKWIRLEKRAASLLMAALPEALKEEVVASKAVTTLGILSKAMLAYQPGGLGERGAILQALENPAEANAIPMAITQLRKWIRWKRRAFEMGVSIPDASILMRGLSRLMKKLLANYPDLNFRLSLVRNALLVDTVPNLESVNKYSEHLLAELEQMGHQSKRKEVSSEVQPKVKKLEESAKFEEKGRPSGKPNEEVEAKKKPCKFFLTESGCKRGKGCQFGHVLDGERRCWSCGGKDHMANNCKRGSGYAEDIEPKVSKVVSKNDDKDLKTSSSTSTPEKKEEVVEGEEKNEDLMKGLLDEANRMLKHLHQADPKEKAVSTSTTSQRMAQQQKQLDEIKIALKPFRLSKICKSASSGLLDSGATHPLRARKKGEKISHLPKVDVTLAGDQQVSMRLSPTGVIIGEEHAEPIVPMGLLASSLKCSITWTGNGVEIIHPKLGPLDVKLQDGCPTFHMMLPSP